MSLVEHLGPYVGAEIPEPWMHTFLDAGGNPIALTGGTVQVIYRVNRGPQVKRTAQIGTGLGQAFYQWVAADLAVAGLMEGEMVVDAPGPYRLARSFRMPIQVPLGGPLPAI